MDGLSGGMVKRFRNNHRGGDDDIDLMRGDPCDRADFRGIRAHGDRAG